MGFFRNMSGAKWATSFPSEFNGLYGCFYTPWFGWSYNLTPGRLTQIWRNKSLKT